MLDRKDVSKTVSHSGRDSVDKLQLLHNDVCGPIQTQLIGGARYFVAFIGDYSRCCAAYFMKHKSSA